MGVPANVGGAHPSQLLWHHQFGWGHVEFPSLEWARKALGALGGDCSQTWLDLESFSSLSDCGIL